MTHLAFRETVTGADAAAVREIVASTGFFTDAEIGVAVELVEERLEKGEKSGYFFVFAEEAGKTVGYASFGPIPCTTTSFDLYWIAVHETLRGHGLGRTVLARAEDAIRRMGGTRVYVETSSRAQYRPTRAFYLHTGYAEAAFLPDFYAPGDGKIVLVKVLGKKEETT